MTPKKKELEIVYNLEWKNKPTTNGDEKSNMVGILDIPATTLDWKTFKSYLVSAIREIGTFEGDFDRFIVVFS